MCIIFCLRKQVALSHSASVFVSMHGAGTTHIFHMAVGSPNCCALVELFPDATIEFQSAQGYGNLARMLGLHYHRYHAPMGTTGPGGTTVEVHRILDLVTAAVRDVQIRPTCLHEASNETKSSFSFGLGEG